MAGINNIYGNKEDVLIIRKSSRDIMISDSSSYDDEILAYIVHDTAGDSWRLIRGRESEQILVNGESLHLVHYLDVGDRIIFDAGRIIYRFAGVKPLNNDGGISRLRRQVAVSVAIVLTVMLVTVGLFFRIDPEDDIRRSEIRRYESSIFKISVKEVICQKVTITEKGVAYDTIGRLLLDTSVPSGTGFLCTDGRLVTARHCVEPWIVMEDPASMYDSYDSKDNTLAVWAADAETYNIRHRKDSLKTYKRLVSVCEVSRNGSVLGQISSDSSFFSIGNDMVRNLRGVRNPLYWRELGHIRSRSSLGDIVYFQTEHRGRINMADQSYIDSLNVDTPAVHIGYPVGQSECSFERSRLMLRRQKDRCLEFKDTDVAKGYSGGPVMVRHNGKLWAVGVLSRIFDKDQRRCVCVPVSETLNAERRWEE